MSTGVECLSTGFADTVVAVVVAPTQRTIAVNVPAQQPLLTHLPVPPRAVSCRLLFVCPILPQRCPSLPQSADRFGACMSSSLGSLAHHGAKPSAPRTGRCAVTSSSTDHAAPSVCSVLSSVLLCCSGVCSRHSATRRASGCTSASSARLSVCARRSRSSWYEQVIVTFPLPPKPLRPFTYP